MSNSVNSVCPVCRSAHIEFMQPPIVTHRKEPYKITIAIPCMCEDKHKFWLVTEENADKMTHKIVTVPAESDDLAFVPTKLTLWPSIMEANAVMMKFEDGGTDVSNIR